MLQEVWVAAFLPALLFQAPPAGFPSAPAQTEPRQLRSEVSAWFNSSSLTPHFLRASPGSCRILPGAKPCGWSLWILKGKLEWAGNFLFPIFSYFSPISHFFPMPSDKRRNFRRERKSEENLKKGILKAQVKFRAGSLPGSRAAHPNSKHPQGLSTASAPRMFHWFHIPNQSPTSISNNSEFCIKPLKFHVGSCVSPCSGFP